jgi:hypothetical protein
MGARHAGSRERDILVNGAVEQDALLQHHADLAAQPSDVDLADVDAVDQDLAALGAVEALDELCQRRFSRARGTDDAEDLARGNVEFDAGERLRSARSVADPPPVMIESTTSLALVTHMLCWSWAMCFSAAASSENDHGSMNFASNTALVPSTTPSRVAAIQRITG